MPTFRPVDVTKAFLYFIARASAGISMVHYIDDLFNHELSEEERTGAAVALTAAFVIGMFAFWTSASDTYASHNQRPDNKLDHSLAGAKAALLALVRFTATYSILRYLFLALSEDNTWLNVAAFTFGTFTGSLALCVSLRESHRAIQYNQQTVINELDLDVITTNLEEGTFRNYGTISNEKNLENHIEKLTNENTQLKEKLAAQEERHEKELLAPHSRLLGNSSTPRLPTPNNEPSTLAFCFLQ